MPNILTIDQGNSSAKIAVWNGTDLVHAVVVPVVSDDDVEDLMSRYDFKHAIYSSVADHQDYLDMVLKGHGLEVTELNCNVETPLVVDYGTPMTLGSDRVAAAVGAMHLYPATELLVVDAGTAVTYDRVTARGHFAGGNIAPGIGMRLKALNAFTARLPLVSSRGETRLWGNTTESAMRSGAFYGVIAEIGYYRSRLPVDARVVITGGWGKQLAANLDFEATYCDELVNVGLNVILSNLLNNNNITQ